MIQVAQAIPFPWEDAVPTRVAAWIECLAKSRNTAQEFVLLGALVSTAAAMGPNTQVQVRATHREPTNLFAIGIGFPGSGKSQAFRLSLSSPLSSMDHPYR